MSRIVQQLQYHISQRYAKQAGKSLWQIYQLEPEMFSPSPALLNFVYRERRAIIATLRSASVRETLIRQCCEMTKAFSRHKNQFISFSAHDEGLLAQIYTRFLAGISLTLHTLYSKEQFETHFRQVLRQHLFELRNFTAAFLTSDTKLPLQEQFIFKEPVCSEYSAFLQLEILGINKGELKEPILDIGCGQHGVLVNDLREKGYDAFGLDRTCPSSPYFISADWLELDFAPHYWGSILSHMAFFQPLPFSSSLQTGAA